MDVVRGPELLDLPQDLPGPVCVIVAPGDSRKLEVAAGRLGLDAGALAALAGPVRSARTDVTAGSVVLSLWTIDAEGASRSTSMAATDRGLVVVDDGSVADEVARVADGAADSRRALAQIVLAVAEQTEEHVARLAASTDDLGSGSNGFFTGEQRRALVASRARLLRIQHQCAAQQRVLARDVDLAEAVPGLAAAAERYAAAADSAAAAYAALGDSLDDLRTTVSERLTIVSTVFLPLTLAGGFFGMNFGWMADHLDGVTTFVVLGIVLPILMTAATVQVVRRLSD
ncbi:MAG TPA: CorA family divalent cation transporter [Blastococcus sp.]|nr:CorA family divalent cation transporter [Blastococcus sp.]